MEKYLIMSIPWDIVGWLFAGVCFLLMTAVVIIERRKSPLRPGRRAEKAQRQGMELLLAEKEAIQESIIYFASSLFRQNTEADILWDITTNCVEKLGFVDCVIYLYDEERQVLLQKAAHGPKDDGHFDIVEPIEIPLGKGIVGAAFEGGTTELVKDVRNDSRYILDDQQRLSELAVPIITPEGRVLGVIDSEHPEENFFTNVHVKVLSTIASICAIKLIRAQADKEILVAKEKAEAATKAKSLFLSTMSHEIRTPLNAVIGISHLLLDDDPLPSQIEQLQTLHFSAKHLLSLVNDILDISKLESGKVDLDYSEIDLPSLCNQLLQTFSPEATEKGLNLELNAPDLQHYVIGDAGRLNQILTNLIGNALKFTTKGEIHIQYEVLAETPEQSQIVFRIKDTGIGIPEEKLETIFLQFEQATEKTTRKYGGSGLGLTICQKLVDIQGGKIGIRSELGQGTECWFWLPFKKGRPLHHIEGRKQEPASWRDQSLAGMKVLLVEDQLINQKIGSKFLQKWNIDIDIAENGEIALNRLLEDHSFDLVLMDLHMPVMGGLEATTAIRKLPEAYFQQIPIVALTADVSENIQQETENRGMNDFLSKPFDPNKLFGILERFYPGLP